MRSTSKNPFFNKRWEPRHPYSGLVLFVYKKNLRNLKHFPGIQIIDVSTFIKKVKDK